eukprot:368024-Pleurochrysis_carterae.AAC.1
MRGRKRGEEAWKIKWKKLRKDKRREAGQQLQAERKAKLDEKRAECAARDAERACIDALPLAKCCSGLLKLMVVEDLRDQLKKHKALGKTGFVVSQPNRMAYALQLQTLLLEADEEASNLDDGDSGFNGRNIRRCLTGRSRKRRRGLTSYTILHGLRVD